MSTSSRTHARRRWTIPIVLGTAVAFTVAIVLGTPLQALLLLGMWLLCPLLMVTMHGGHARDRGEVPVDHGGPTMEDERRAWRVHGEGDGPPRR